MGKRKKEWKKMNLDKEEYLAVIKYINDFNSSQGIPDKRNELFKEIAQNAANILTYIKAAEKNQDSSKIMQKNVALILGIIESADSQIIKTFNPLEKLNAMISGRLDKPAKRNIN